ncbi:MAG: tetratricopeptide repeat protein [Candidatus Omnitrophota bacterium]
MKNILKKPLAWFPGSVLALYLVAAVVLGFWGNGHTAWVRSLVRMGVMEWDRYPLSLARGDVAVDKAALRRALRYYKTLAGAFPSLGQAYDMMGFCYFYLDDLPRAARAYEKAVARAPQFFWHDYHLGLAYFRQGFFDKALAAFDRILAVPVEEVPRWGIYAPLTRMDPDTRRRYYQQGELFAVSVREEAWSMAFRACIKMKKYDQAGDLAVRALRDPFVRNKKEFLVYAQALTGGRRDLFDTVLKEDMAAAGKRPLLHPWFYVIPVGKEIYY